MRTAKTLIRLGDAQADLSLHLAYSHFVGFVMSRLILFTQNTRNLQHRCMRSPILVVTLYAALENGSTVLSG